MPHLPVTRFLVFLVSLSLAAVLSLFPTRALAHDAPAPPPHAISAVVRVDAYEHSSYGTVVGDGTIILVPFETIEVDRAGFPHAIVSDARGTRHPAGVAATDRKSGLALLVVEHPLTTTPLELSTSRITDPIDTFALAYTSETAPLADGAWWFYPAGILAGEGSVHPDGRYDGQRRPPLPHSGSPVIDTSGKLVAIMGAGMMLAPSPLDVSPALLARLDGETRTRRSRIYYAGIGFPVSFSTSGGVWVGLGASIGARIRDVAELRLDAEFSALARTALPACADDACSNQGTGAAGVRGVATPSIGYRYVLGGIGGSRAWPIAFTPSVGLALGVQSTSRENGAPAYDAATPNTWAQIAPGATLSILGFELRGRVRVPFDGSRAATTELALGLYF